MLFTSNEQISMYKHKALLLSRWGVFVLMDILGSETTEISLAFQGFSFISILIVYLVKVNIKQMVTGHLTELKTATYGKA